MGSPVEKQIAVCLTPMHVSLFDFILPPERIALRPATPRESAKLLQVGATGELTDHTLYDLPGLLAPGDALVVNDTRVIPARLRGTRQRGGSVARMHVTLHKRESASSWRAFVRPAKKLAFGERVRFGVAGGGCLPAGRA